MIYARLAGGLGNQLFQLACALDARVGDEGILLVTDGLRSYKAAREPDVARIVDLDALGVAIGTAPRPFVSGALALRLPRLLAFTGLSDRNFVGRAAHRRDTPRRTLLLDGYFQRGWDWASLDATLATLSGALRTGLAPAPRSVAVHVRGTDFLQSASHQLISGDYYQRAFARLCRLQPVRTAVVVTDDPAYARRVLDPMRLSHPDLDIEIGQDPSTIERDFSTLCSAAGRIIPNSTFSWWAAALDPKRAPTISPDRFVRDAPRHQTLPWEHVIPAGSPAADRQTA